MPPRIRLTTLLAGIAACCAITPRLPAQSFSIPVDVNLGIGALPARITGTAAGDLDGDGFGDLVATDDASPARLGYALGAAGGSYATQTPIAVPGTTGLFHPRVADFDHDGQLDVAMVGNHNGIAGHLAAYVALSTSSGGGFALSAPLFAYDLGPGTLVTDLAVTDFDRNGYLDLLATVRGPALNLLVVLRGDVPPSPSVPIAFAPLSSITTSVGPEAVDVCVDFNHDGEKDLVICGTGGPGPTVEVWPGHGAQTPGPPIRLALPAGADPYDVHWIDCDQNGFYDLAVASAGVSPRLHLIRNLGAAPYFAAASVSPAHPLDHSAISLLRLDADFDGAEDLSVLKVIATGNPPYQTVLDVLKVEDCALSAGGALAGGVYNPGLVNASVADLHAVDDQNLDGKQDLILVTHTQPASRLRVYRNTAPTTFTISPTRPGLGAKVSFTYDIATGAALANRRFLILFSLAGTLPGIDPMHGPTVPLNAPLLPLFLPGTLSATGSFHWVAPSVMMPAVPTFFSAQLAAAALVEGALPGSLAFASNPAVITLP